MAYFPGQDPIAALAAIEAVIERRIDEGAEARPTASAALYEIDRIVREALASGVAVRRAA